MSDLERRYHETWLGMVQPTEGLVVSVPVLVDAGCMERQAPELQRRLHTLCEAGGDEPDSDPAVKDLPRFLAEILDLPIDEFDAQPDGGVADAGVLPKDLKLYVHEGRQTLAPTLGLRKPADAPEVETPVAAMKRPSGSFTKLDDDMLASRAGENYAMLVWQLPDGLPLDKSETVTGPWEYPPSAKFDRLLRHCHVPIGLLTNGRAFRLIYAPHGESSGSITFRLADMLEVGGRPILDAMVMLLSGFRFFGAQVEYQLPQLLAESRNRQADVTEELADQVFEALQILLSAFQAAAERDGSRQLDEALTEDADQVYGGLLTILLRMVFVLYAEDRGLLPMDNGAYAEDLSLLGLFEQLQSDADAYPDSMHQRFGAWGRFIALCRTIFLGAEHGDLQMPARRGELFDPHRFPFLEGWGPAGSAPITDAEQRGAVQLPTVDDGSIFRVLQQLLYLKGQRLSYRALDVEQIGSVYESLMGYHIQRVADTAVCLRPERVWVTAAEVLEQPASRRAKWLKEAGGLAKAQATKAATAIQEAEKGADPTAAMLDVLRNYRFRKSLEARPGSLVLQPGEERRRTSSHYTPRSLSAPIVERTLEPLIVAMGETPSSEALLDLKVCDPAMGSGAFLVEACRFLGDQVVAAWTRERKLEELIKSHEDIVNYARRLVAQRCLYGVDKNKFAVSLAKLSLWLVTLAKDEPFTFVDHSLRHGDSLVGLDFDQIRAFHWQPSEQMELCSTELDNALSEAIELRQRILELANDPSPQATREKQRLLGDAEDALDRVRLIGDLVVGAFFAKSKAKARDAERARRLDAVADWLRSGAEPPPELKVMQEELQQQLTAFHWMVEFPEVFYEGRKDPLAEHMVNEAAFLDAVIGNPPFMGGSQISGTLGAAYRDWLLVAHPHSHGNSDIVAHLFRRGDVLLGVHGTIGLIATNTIAQGDTRETGLRWLIEHGYLLYDATCDMPWPGAAAVTVSIVHVGKGLLASGTPVSCRLNGKPSQVINSRLQPRAERADASRLARNANRSFLGSKIYGQGFLLTPDEREQLIARNSKNAERIFPYIGGQEVNTSPTQDFHRYVINFAQMTLEEAKRWPDLLQIVQEKVKPERDNLRNNADGRRLKQYWWQWGRYTPALYKAIADLPRRLVTAQVTKHLCFSFQPVDRVYSQKLIVFPFYGYSHFAVLQSRVHVPWAWLLSSTMRRDLSYSPSDCFETFPLPTPEHLKNAALIDQFGHELYTARASYMVEQNQGLTQTYNKLKDPDCTDTEIVELRELHLEMDRAVLAAYGWDDITVPPLTTPATDGERKAFQAFEDEVIDRLFVLNAERAAEEKKRFGSPKKKASKKTKKKTNTKAAGQLSLVGDTPEDE